jgi:Cd2+/Zn2+-exporting ATPase
MIEKTKIELSLLLPSAADTPDACVERLWDLLKGKDGIESAHLVEHTDQGHEEICIHYDPNRLTIREVRDLAERAGAEIDNRYGNVLLNSDTIVESFKDGVKSHAKRHEQDGLFGERTELIFAVICGGLLLSGFLLSFLTINPWVPTGLYLGAYVFGGFYMLRQAIKSVLIGRFEIDFLMLLAAIGAASLGEWAEGALLLFLFSLGHALEHYAPMPKC